MKEKQSQIGLNDVPAAAVDGDDIAVSSRTCCTSVNTTAVLQATSPVIEKFDLMSAKRAYFHWYTEHGMDESEFKSARDDYETYKAGYADVAIE